MYLVFDDVDYSGQAIYDPPKKMFSVLILQNHILKIG